MWFNRQLRYNHLRLFLLCSIICFGITFTRLQLEAIQRHESEGNDFAVQFRDSVNGNFKHNGRSTDVEIETGKFRSNSTTNLATSPLPKISYESKTASKQNVIHETTASSNATSKEDPLNDTNGSPTNSHEQKDFEVVIKNNGTAEISEFIRQEGVAIVTKVHGPHQLALLKQSMCLLHQAYNKKVGYDIVVFTTVPITEDEPLLVDIRAMISPVRLRVVVDNDGIVNEIHKLSPLRRKNFLSRCNASSPEEITWDSECYEEGVGMGRIGYNWQAEFRSWHIWRHEGLRHYRYMMWIDTDAFCTRAWDRDPIAIAMKNQMVIYFDNYPQGRAKAAHPRVQEVFGKSICFARKSPNGQLYTSVGEDCGGSQLWTIHGFFHITSLDFFRQEEVIRWAETMIGDCFVCRKFDDQLAVTVPAVLLAPERSWDMYKSGVQLEIFHNNLIDGKRGKKAGGFATYWSDNAESQFPEAWNTCEISESS
jgi:hypothetical protein